MSLVFLRRASVNSLAEGSAPFKGMAAAVAGSTKAGLSVKQKKGKDKWSSNGTTSSSSHTQRSLSATQAAVAAGDEEKQHKRGQQTTAAAAAAATKSQKKAEAERVLAFDVVRRTLLAPVTHISSANGGRPHDPATFASFAKPAQEKVSDVRSDRRVACCCDGSM